PRPFLHPSAIESRRDDVLGWPGCGQSDRVSQRGRLRRTVSPAVGRGHRPWVPAHSRRVPHPSRPIHPRNAPQGVDLVVRTVERDRVPRRIRFGPGGTLAAGRGPGRTSTDAVGCCLGRSAAAMTSEYPAKTTRVGWRTTIAAAVCLSAVLAAGWDIGNEARTT